MNVITMTASDMLALLYLVLLLLAVLLSNSLFAAFIAAKPEGRKTVLGGKIWTF